MMKLPVDQYHFPEEWQIIPVDKIAMFARGVSWRKSEEAEPQEGTLVVSIPNIKDGFIDFNSKFNHYISKQITDGKRLRIGDILFVGSSGSIHNVGRNAMVRHLPSDLVAFASFTFKASRADNEVDNDFIYYLLNSEFAPYDQFCKRAADGKFNFQLRQFCTELRVPLPPPQEQQNIAKLLSEVYLAIGQQERLIALSTELKKALMHKLFTEGTQGEKQKQTEIGPVPESWKVYRLGDIAESFQYGTSVKCNYEINGAPVLRIPNVVGGHVDISDLKFGILKRNELELLKLNYGDLLFVRTNGVKENAGRCSMYRGEFNEDCYFASYLIRVRIPCDKLLPGFVGEYCRTSTGASLLSGRAIRTADGKFNINSGTLKEMLVPMPKADEQSEITETAFLINKKLFNHVEKRQQLIDLFRNLLHQLMTAQIRVNDLDLFELDYEPLAIGEEEVI